MEIGSKFSPLEWTGFIQFLNISLLKAPELPPIHYLEEISLLLEDSLSHEETDHLCARSQPPPTHPTHISPHTHPLSV